MKEKVLLALANSLRKFCSAEKSLDELDISYNLIKAEGIHLLRKALGKFLGNKIYLKKLNISGNKIKCEGRQDLLEMLKQNFSGFALQGLNISYNGIDDVSDFLNLDKYFFNLQEFISSGNGIFQMFGWRHE